MNANIKLSIYENLQKGDQLPPFQCIEKFKNTGKLTGTGMAPHVLNLAEISCLSVNKLCIASTQVLDDKEPRNANDHEVLINYYDCTGSTRVMINQLLEKLQLKHVYTISITNERDYNGQIGHFTMLAAIWKSLSTFEEGGAVGNDEDNIWLKDNFQRYLIHNDFQMQYKEMVVSAIFDGSSTDAFLLPIPGVEETVRRTSSVNFWKKCDLMFASTNLHNECFRTNSLFSGKNKCEEQSSTIRRQLGERNNRLALDEDLVPKLMMLNSSYRTSGNSSEKHERRCYETMKNLEKRHPEKICGFEIVQGGILIVLKKENLNKKEFAKTIMTNIIQNLSGITEVRIDYIYPSREPRSFSFGGDMEWNTDVESDCSDIGEEYGKRRKAEKPSRNKKLVHEDSSDEGSVELN
ncbi:hypothetical protein GCK72_024882 [Caenorhabditis remanei]|uniref:Switch protein XOL-1 N-terminal domain-containing protein n=1 Tax=Caenorhabditis remanei TaxID=31234 RepID=A0A6A5G182_CAERE|nr:hypothetical protein GCK72_024882 [Caenorhabditis remanei]KAF1748415.1 hypothetical protein GCK72_024882 [Caenorhabditis remanei]